MKREVLKSYFEKTCSASEAAMVEEWLLNAQHQVEFEAFLESYWAEHTEEAMLLSASQKRSALRRYWPRVAAAAALVGVMLLTVHYLTRSTDTVESHAAVAAVEVKPQVLPAAVNTDTARPLTKSVAQHKPKTKRYGKKHPPETVVAQVPPVAVPDTATKPAEPRKSMKMTAFKKVMFNDSVFSKLSRADQIAVFNQMALKVNFHNATFSDLVTTFRDRYGIVLELCAGTDPDKVVKEYTASFAQIALPDLIHDMSAQMMFSYTVSNNVVKVCFN